MSLIVIDMLGEEDDIVIIASDENLEKDKEDNQKNKFIPCPELQLEIVETNYDTEPVNG